MPQPLVFTRDQIRKVDQLAVERYHIPSIVLMENASRGLADHALRMLGDKRRVLIICGGGNNGGDGLAAARHLHNRSIDVTIYLTRPAESYTGDALINLRICQAMNLSLMGHDTPPEKLPPADLLLDGLFGTGLTEPVRPPFDAIIQWMNRQPAPILAIDIPSGLDCDTGKSLGVAVKAAATVSFVGMKLGFLDKQAKAYTGTVYLADIGAPWELAAELGQPMK